MKGVVFTEFFSMVEEVFDADMVDHLIEATNPSSLGAYTSVGSYDYAELEAMVVELSSVSKMEIETLLTAVGKHLGAQFATNYTSFFTTAGDTYSLLKQIDQHIHVEVRKLYPDAELPEFDFIQSSENDLLLKYRSTRPLADLAHGLILQTAQYFGENLTVEMHKWQEDEWHKCDFTLTKS